MSCKIVSWKIKANLVNDPQTLPELLDTTHVTVVAITVLSNGDVKLDLFVREFSWATDAILEIRTSSYLS